MATLNQVNLIGRLGKDPEIRYATQTQDPIASFSVATGGEKFKDKQTGEERQTETEWHNCTAFGNTAKVVQNYIKKGSQVYITGKLKTEKYTDKNGVEKRATKIIVNSLLMLGSKADNLQQTNQQPQPNTAPKEYYSFYTPPQQQQPVVQNTQRFNTWGQPVQPQTPATNFTPTEDFVDF